MRAPAHAGALLGGSPCSPCSRCPRPRARTPSPTGTQIAAAALQSPGTATPPGAGQGAASTAHLAMVHAAVYDAVNAIDGGHEPYVSSPAAAAVVLAGRRRRGRRAPRARQRRRSGSRAARMPVIEAAYQATLAAIPDGPAKAGGIATGEAAAADMIAARARRRPLRAVPLHGRDAARRMAAGAAGDGDRPRGLAEGRHSRSCSATRIVFRGRGAARARHAGVRGRLQRGQGDRAGDRARPGRPTRRRRRSTGARPTPPRRWRASSARSRAARAARLADHARLFARVYTNAADALIVTWRDKARYSFWRPITAIHEAASDGNDATEADPDWTSLIAAPPYPDHPRGLSAFGCAVADTMQHFYGRDGATFSGTTPGGVTRHVHELLAAARRHRRRPRVVRHPLPVRRRGGREDRAQGRPLGQPARLPLIR